MYRSTLTKYKGSMLRIMFSTRREMIKRDEEGAYLLDRDPEIFATILKILRLECVPRDIEMTHSLETEMRYLGLLDAFGLSTTTQRSSRHPAISKIQYEHFWTINPNNAPARTRHAI